MPAQLVDWKLKITGKRFDTCCGSTGDGELIFLERIMGLGGIGGFYWGFKQENRLWLLAEYSYHSSYIEIGIFVFQLWW
jgi:hypothetical protein